MTARNARWWRRDDRQSRSAFRQRDGEFTGREVKVSLPGGDLLIEWRTSDGHILMTGPYALDYEGTLPAELFAAARV